MSFFYGRYLLLSVIISVMDGGAFRWFPLTCFSLSYSLSFSLPLSLLSLFLPLFLSSLPFSLFLPLSPSLFHSLGPCSCWCQGSRGRGERRGREESIAPCVTRFPANQ